MRDRLVKGSKMQSYKEELELDWHNDMIWWGPGGIGASYTIDGYQKGHTKPFQDGLEFVRFNGHILSSSEDDLGGWFGWPNLIMKPKGEYLGLTNASDSSVGVSPLSSAILQYCSVATIDLSLVYLVQSSQIVKRAPSGFLEFLYFPVNTPQAKGE